MKSLLELLIVSVMLAAISGCAGAKADHIQQPAAPNPVQWPQDRINESFHFKPRDAVSCRFFASQEQEHLPAAVRLESLILHEMAQADSEKELNKAFDRLWTKEVMVRDLIGNKAQREKYPQATALLHYLLVAGHDSSWKQAAADRLYLESLERIDPSRLYGYSLHFHILALLKTGRFEEALEYFEQLRKQTDSAVYIQDMVVALGYALEGDGEVIAGRLMAGICRAWVISRGDFPDREMVRAVIVLKQEGEIEPVRWALAQVIEQHPELRNYSFASLLVPDAEQERRLAVTVTGQGTDARQVLIKVQVIMAGSKRVFIDPALAKTSNELLEPIRYSSLELIGEKSFPLASGQKAVLPLPDGFQLWIQPDRLEQDSARLEVRIRKGLREKLHILIESVNGGVTTFVGPQSGNGVILLRITTYNLDAKQV